MNTSNIKINWPDGSSTYASPGTDWLEACKIADFKIPTGCLGGSCGACEIEVNGEVIRACISNINDNSNKGVLNVEISCDPFW